MTEQQQLMRALIQRVATGPELSKSITFAEATAGMRSVLLEQVAPVQAAVFLIALRMKRETREENLGVLQALIDETRRIEIDANDVIDIADPYDGYTRGLPVSTFLPAVLAAAGLKVTLTGADAIGPKFGITHNKVLRAAGVEIPSSMDIVGARLADPDVGWAYIDQHVFCPALHRLAGLRTLMVKRTCLSTVEVLLRPVAAKGRTHLVTGYVHKPYPPVYTMLARHAGYDSAMIIRGVEGGVVPSLTQPAKVFSFYGPGQDDESRIEPSLVDIRDHTSRAVPVPAAAKKDSSVDEIAAAINVVAAARNAAAVGLAALNGEHGPAYDSLVYTGALVLTHLRRAPSLHDAAKTIRNILDCKTAVPRYLGSS